MICVHEPSTPFPDDVDQDHHNVGLQVSTDAACFKEVFHYFQLPQKHQDLWSTSSSNLEKKFDVWIHENVQG
jgi:hypothetical protein